MTEVALTGNRRSDGFIERGHQVTRLEAFVDAAFALATTLIMISIDQVPRTMQDLKDGLTEIPAFIACFAVIVMFWLGHNTWSRRYGLDDRKSLFLSLLLVMIVLIWVYPLRMMYGTAFAWLGFQLGLPPSMAPRMNWQANPADIQLLFICFGIAWSSLGLVIAALYRNAWKKRHELKLSRQEMILTRSEIASWQWIPFTGLVSITLALLIGPVQSWQIGLPGFAYCLMFFSWPVSVIAARSAKKRLAAEEGESAPKAAETEAS